MKKHFSEQEDRPKKGKNKNNNMSNQLRTIKFTSKKCVMKPMENEEGLIETWELTDNPICKEFFTYKGNKYKLVSSVEKKN